MMPAGDAGFSRRKFQKQNCRDELGQAAPSCAGLTRVSIHPRKTFSRKMSCRVKPGNDDAERGHAETPPSS
jgi:hypothetical protein